MRGTRMSIVSPRLLCLVGVGCFASVSQAALFFSEQFNYADGNLYNGTCSGGLGSNGTNGGWASHSGCGSNPIPVLSQKVTTEQNTGSREDDNKALGVTMGVGQKFYAAFDVAVDLAGASTGDVPVAALTASGSSGFEYFAHFKDIGTAAFRSRVFVVNSTDEAHPNFSFGLSNSSVTPATRFLPIPPVGRLLVSIMAAPIAWSPHTTTIRAPWRCGWIRARTPIRISRSLGRTPSTTSWE